MWLWYCYGVLSEGDSRTRRSNYFSWLVWYHWFKQSYLLDASVLTGMQTLTLQEWNSWFSDLSRDCDEIFNMQCYILLIWIIVHRKPYTMPDVSTYIVVSLPCCSVVSPACTFCSTASTVSDWSLVFTSSEWNKPIGLQISLLTMM